jgi:hypothetical protein
MNKINSHKEVISEIKKLRSILLSEIEIKDISGLSKYGRKDEKLPSNKYFIIHHTASGGDAERIVSILNNRKNKKTGKVEPLGVQYVIDREGKVFRTLPSGSRGAHILNSDDFASAPKGINNSTAQGVEVIGMNDEDILPEQAVAALKLVKQLGFKPDQIYGHGKINPGHKAATEGMTIKKFIDRNYNQPEFLYDYSDFPESKRPKPEWQDWSQSEVDSEFEKIIDKFGVEDIANVSSESDCEKYIKEVIELFGEGHITKKDNFCDSLLLGLPIKEFVEAAKETEKVKEEEKKKEEEEKKKEEEEKKKEEEEKKKEEEETKLTEELKNFKRFIK